VEAVTNAVLALRVCEQLCDGLARASSPEDALGHIAVACDALLGPGLLTVNLVAARPGKPGDEFELQRAWSSNPVDYPVGGRKRKAATAWTQQLLVRGEVFVGEGEEALAAAFDDATRIAALGLKSVINVPLLSGNDCIATFNVLGMRASWRPEEIAAVRLLALLAQPFVLRIAPA
jgi:hypothetical protein